MTGSLGPVGRREIPRVVPWLGNRRSPRVGTCPTSSARPTARRVRRSPGARRGPGRWSGSLVVVTVGRPPCDSGSAPAGCRWPWSSSPDGGRSMCRSSPAWWRPWRRRRRVGTWPCAWPRWRAVTVHGPRWTRGVRVCSPSSPERRSRSSAPPSTGVPRRRRRCRAGRWASCPGPRPARRPPRRSAHGRRARWSPRWRRGWPRRRWARTASRLPPTCSASPWR